MIMLIPLLLINILTTDAMMIPKSPMIMKLPIEVRSFLVTHPYTLQIIKVAAQIKNVDVIDDLVYIRKIADRVAPFSTA